MMLAHSNERPRKRRPGPGRPRLDERERRTVRLTVRLTERELSVATERAAAVGLRLRAYLRACALEGGDPAVSTPSSGAAQIERLALLRDALRHLAKAGSNVNQIARHANRAALEDKPVPPVLAAAAEALAELRAALVELRTWPALRPARGIRRDEV